MKDFLRASRPSVRFFGPIGLGLPAPLLVALIFASTLPGQPPANQGTNKAANTALRAQLEKLPVEELIDRLQQEVAPAFILDPAMTGDQPFLAIDSDPRWPSFFPNKHGTNPSDLLRELVRRGLRALPSLLHQLDDARSTKVIVSSIQLLVNAQDDDIPEASEVITETQAPGIMVPGRDQARADRTGFQRDRHQRWTYTMKVGDLCYIAAGQIVNRDLKPIGKRGGVTGLASPVYEPHLAAACRRAWGGFTAEQHKDALVDECLDKAFDAKPTDALLRLYFYYPQVGEKLIVDHLRRPLIEKEDAWKFCNETLLSLADQEMAQVEPIFALVAQIHQGVDQGIESLWSLGAMEAKAAWMAQDVNDALREILNLLIFLKTVSLPSKEQFLASMQAWQKKQGKEMAEEIPLWLRFRIKNDAGPGNYDAVSCARIYKARFFLETLCGDIKTYRNPFLNRSSVRDMTHFVDTLPEYASNNIDRAIHDVFQKVISGEATGKHAPWLARACIKKLAGKGYDPELRRYLEIEIENAKKASTDPNVAWQLEHDADLMRKLKN